MDVNPTAWAWSQISEKNLSAAQGLVLLAIARHASDEHEGICWPGATSIHQRCGLDYRYVKRIIRILEHQFHLFETIRSKFFSGTDTTSFYVLNLPRDRPPSDILRALRRLRGNVKFNETLFLAGGRTLHFGEGPQTPLGGSIDPGLQTPVGGSMDPGLQTPVGGSPNPGEEGSQTPPYEYSNEGEGESSLQDSPREIHNSLSTVRPGGRKRTVKEDPSKDFQKYWGPVEGKLRQSMVEDQFLRYYAGIRVLQMTALDVTLAVPPALIAHFANAEKTARILARQIDDTQTGFLRGRNLVVVPLTVSSKEVHQ